ncbi:MAG TPA: Gfo/Idh/MocA family oxidoreductase [Blastocatellia bacterium]|nr:Gfo/Idh/MocA family oxidoreductase [Blastocatellia bacterium]
MSQSRMKQSRRSFLETTAAGAAGLILGSSSRATVGPARGASDPVKVGIIGIGGQGRELTRNLATVANARITALCDIFEPNLIKGVDLAGSQPKTFTDYRKMIDSKDIDAVVIATPLHLHADMSIAALNAGKHVFVEKTMAYSVSQCEQMVRASKANPGLVVQVGHQHRFDPVINRVLDMCRGGALGKITHIRCHWHRNGNWRRPVPKSDFDPRAWGYPSLEHLINWRMYKKYSGGLMCELGSHMIEIVNLIYGSMPEMVTGLGGIDYWKDGRETYDNVTAVYSYPAGQKAMFSSTTTNAHDGEKIKIMGTDGTIEMSWDQALYFHEKEPPELVKADGATVITATGETMKASEQKQAVGARVQAPTSRVNAVHRELESFVTSIRGGKKAEVDVHVGRNAAVSVLLANRAMEEGRVIKF